MKKCLLMLLMAAMMISAAAHADSRAAILDGRLFLSVSGGETNESQLVHDAREIRHLQSDGEYLFYVVCDPVDEEHHFETLMRMDKDGSETVLAGSRLCGAEYAYAENYSQLTDYTFYQGYGDMKVYGDYIYFIGSSEKSGSYMTAVNDWDGLSGEYETRYAGCASIYRMDKDGHNLVELVSGLGNDRCHMDIADGVIALSSCWRNAIYAYDFSDFMLYDLDGRLIREIENRSENRHSWIYKEDCEFTCIVTAIRTDGEKIYASLGDSEGDFASGRLTDMDNPDETILYEAFYTPAVLTSDGFLALVSEAEDEFRYDGMENELSLQIINPEGAELLACVPAEFIDWNGIYLDLLGDVVYLSSGSRVVRVSISGGGAEEYIGGKFVEAPSFDSK